jgi:hypothetical protein
MIRRKENAMRTLTAVRTLLFAFVILAMSASLFAQINIAIRIGPPALPVYEQPVCPGEGYIWTPGYWAYDYDVNDYYWVPGTWVLAPQPGYFWTPAYWGWENDRFLFHQGYWGPRVGFYGGINYGYGYFGNGYEGGRWDHDRFFYNHSVNNINVVNIHNVYNTTIVHETIINRVSYNGGNGGINARPTREQEEIFHERHMAPLPAQIQHMQVARNDHDQRASVNRGRPGAAAVSRPGELHANPIVSREGARESNVPRPGNPVHPRDLPTYEPARPNAGSANWDQKYRQQQDKMYAKEDHERQKLQQRQDRDHEKLERQHADDARMQQVEQKHGQQTQKLEQRQMHEEQQMQTRMQAHGEHR